MTYSLVTTYKKLLADTVTPVSIYLKLRDKFVNSILLESSDYHGNENSYSYICCQPMARFELNDTILYQQFPDATEQKTSITDRHQVVEALHSFCSKFSAEAHEFPFINNGVFGYIAYNTVRYFEDISLAEREGEENKIPDMIYQVFRYVIVINHFKEELYIFEHTPQLESNKESESGLDYIASLIQNKNYPSYTFSLQAEEISNLSNPEFLKILAAGQHHCQIGDVFQIVLSRRFSRKFSGDEFNVYRALRSVNPSPYLFYFDFGSFKIFGSSPEAQITIQDRKACIYPIAGTFRRSGNDKADAELARKLYDDPKENAEHVMLVDLARNDLSRNGMHVKVDTFKEIQYYSHVIHLVSKVSSIMDEKTSTVQMVADTFPAGTLSGAPKHRAMQLIDQYEPTGRSYYGGCIGFMGFNGNFNHAIMIRSFLSKNNTLYYQAGAGVVAKSNIESELQEVNNKLAALRKALDLATDI
ncbi:anthranilate synthase component I family protein [Rhodocytophaga rosea]|uniref:Anthranilate synthase component 1 n=1 Tax=Rhodocytophaga rosea TaxID=2704465 RepID=A0A6C0GL46_9BACT|nr:anthranilate synthase component I family protein [Rhodocytophaga rosea]QHT68667.1 anthranilate synthase component I family protein [Rhodocytophaga rosea]